jgi:NADH-quinone oxidoreductase subunit J
MDPILLAGGLMLALTCGAALALALTRRLVHAAVWLFLVLMGTAGLFAVAGAAFPAVSQLIVYVGGVLILVVFGIMLTSDQVLGQPASRVRHAGAGLAVACGLGGLLVLAWQQMPTGPEAGAATVSAAQIGAQSLTQYLLPFEIVSCLLLAALAGAVAAARSKGR